MHTSSILCTKYYECSLHIEWLKRTEKGKKKEKIIQIIKNYTNQIIIKFDTKTSYLFKFSASLLQETVRCEINNK